ncbi:uncharacterized protein [Littorina saxatilis]|uniref:C-type lectin domain-containing protein n=1 Tax=Littorina saxatilis TaxID=31220 RepID=A0AAN9B5Z2_9CAEN
MATWPGSLLNAAVVTGIVCYYCVTYSAANGISTTPGLSFLRDSSFDNRKVTSDPDGLDLDATTVAKCAYLCSATAWCTSFFYTQSSGACTLHVTAFIAPSDASDSVGTRYYTTVVDWCRPQLVRVYNRQAEMCMYFETDLAKIVPTWQTADSRCVDMGMRLASNITPLKMDAILNVTKTPTMVTSLFIGLLRIPPAGNNEMQWMDGEPMDVAAMEPYWEPGQPNGGSSQLCVVIETHPGKNFLVDVGCNVAHEFVCEVLKP